jgi:peptidoglycan hydrolase CwlO-like protein
MHKYILTKRIVFSAFVIALGIGFTNCTPMVTPEQLAKLQELRKREVVLNEDISKANSNISKIQNELNQRMAEVKKCNDEKDYLNKKLANWPNVWPDSGEEKK